MLLLADVDKYSFTNAAYFMYLFHHDINEVVKQSSNTPCAMSRPHAHWTMP